MIWDRSLVLSEPQYPSLSTTVKQVALPTLLRRSKLQRTRSAQHSVGVSSPCFWVSQMLTLRDENLGHWLLNRTCISTTGNWLKSEAPGPHQGCRPAACRDGPGSWSWQRSHQALLGGDRKLLDRGPGSGCASSGGHLCDVYFQLHVRPPAESGQITRTPPLPVSRLPNRIITIADEAPSQTQDVSKGTSECGALANVPPSPGRAPSSWPLPSPLAPKRPPAEIIPSWVQCHISSQP